ncbi:MAG: nucleotidyltransferase domain-containing protein, partial [Agrococcus sp.]
SRAGVQKSVARYLEQGTVVERRVGRSRAFALNDEHLLAAPIRQIAASKRLLLSRMREAVAEWPVQPITVTLFGSAARNEMRVDSDIDVLIVMPDEAEDTTVEELVGELTARTARWTGNDVRPLVYRASEVEPATVFEAIIEDKVNIAGDPAWLRRRLRRTSAAA